MPSLRARMPARSRTETVQDLRRLMSRMEGLEEPDRPGFSFGLPALDACLPRQGLVLGGLHEIAPGTEADLPAALGFLTALLARLETRAPVLMILSARGLARNTRISGRGLNTLGLDPTRLICITARNETEALWASEEALRSRVPAAVLTGLGAKLDLKTSQRLQIAARDAARPLFLLRPPEAEEALTASTRWRITSAPSVLDTYGMTSRWRWRTALVRCRNGRPGEWVLEYDHATHCFSLAAALVDHPVLEARRGEDYRRAG